jgi:hypothetical protein
MVNFTNRDGFELWLDDKPSEWAQVLAARSALRVLPIALASPMRDAHHRLTHIPRIPSILRSLALVWTAARYPTIRGHAQYQVVASEIVAFAERWEQEQLTAPIGTPDEILDASTAKSIARAVVANLSARDFTLLAVASVRAAAEALGDDIWKAASFDSDALEGGMSAALVAGLPLVPPGSSINWTGNLGALQHYSLAVQAEEWQVWNDWYWARFQGSDPWPEEVEVACALIPDEIWRQGPALVSAEIRRIREAWASKQAAVSESAEVAEGGATPMPSVTEEQIEQLIASVSPKPFLTVDGKLDAGRNPEFDSVVSSADLSSLPLQQQALIRAILSDFGANAPKSVRSALEEYRDELKARGLQPILGVLNNMASIVQAACGAKNATIEWLDEGAQRAVELFLANHDLLVRHFPLDAEREALIASIFVDEEAAEGKALSQPFEDVAQATKEAHANGLTTDDFAKIVDKLTDFAKVLATQPRELPLLSDTSTAVKHSDSAQDVPPIKLLKEDRQSHSTDRAFPKKRFILGAFGLIVGAVHLLSSGMTVTGSANALIFVEKLLAFVKAIGQFVRAS